MLFLYYYYHAFLLLALKLISKNPLYMMSTIEHFSDFLGGEAS